MWGLFFNMNYQETVEWLFNKLPMYQQQGAVAYKADLNNTILLAKHLKNPENELKTIHIAGTNGKGSTSSLLASVLQEAGYSIGLFTSPHLKDYRERIKINGKEISEEFVINFVAKNKSFFENHQLSFFEMTTGLALEYFSENKVDFAIMEVGMGGRLDSTNIITPLVSVITNIGFDHMAFLGNTLEAIAGEKAGIIKKNIPVVIGQFTKETKPIFIQKARQTNSEIYFSSEIQNKDYPSTLLGKYQYYNKKTVVQTLKVLEEKKLIEINENNIIRGFLKVIENTSFYGRWQLLNKSPKTICDTAHNKDGLSIVFQQIQEEKYNQLHIVLGMVNDKDLMEILPLFPSEAKYYFCSPAIKRGLDSQVLKEKAAKFGLIGKVYLSVSEAYQEAVKNANPDDFIYVGGSTFVVAEIL